GLGQPVRLPLTPLHAATDPVRDPPPRNLCRVRAGRVRVAQQWRHDHGRGFIILGGSGAPRRPKRRLYLRFRKTGLDRGGDRGGQKTGSGKPIHVEAIPMGSGDCVDEILNGQRQPTIISPASAAFIKLGNAESRVKAGKDLVGPTKNLVLSPVVIAMWEPMAKAIGWGTRPVGWGDVVGLARQPGGGGARGPAGWGGLRFGHTHRRASNSGLISLLAEAYAGAGKISTLTLDDVRKPATTSFVQSVEQSVVHYGSSTGFFGRKMFANGPGYLSAAVLY